MTAKQTKAAPARYAAGTRVGAASTSQQVQDYLRSRGAQNIVVTQDDDLPAIVCAFRLFGRIIQMREKLPTAATPRMRRKSGFREPSNDDIARRVDTETARKWRVLYTRVKMRLDLVFEEEDETEREAAFQYEFLGDTALPGGGTVQEFMAPQVAEAYATGAPPRLLPGSALKQIEGGD